MTNMAILHGPLENALQRGPIFHLHVSLVDSVFHRCFNGVEITSDAEDVTLKSCPLAKDPSSHEIYELDLRCLRDDSSVGTNTRLENLLRGILPFTESYKWDNSCVRSDSLASFEVFRR
jgi:hypothetical protein